NISRARWNTGVSRHGSKAAAAALTARSTSAPLERGTWAMTSPVAGLYTGSLPVASGSTHSPPMKLRRRTTSACGCAVAIGSHLLFSAVHDFLQPAHHPRRVGMLPHV